MSLVGCFGVAILTVHLLSDKSRGNDPGHLNWEDWESKTDVELLSPLYMIVVFTPIILLGTVSLDTKQTQRRKPNLVHIKTVISLYLVYAAEFADLRFHCSGLNTQHSYPTERQWPLASISG